MDVTFLLQELRDAEDLGVLLGLLPQERMLEERLRDTTEEAQRCSFS